MSDVTFDTFTLERTLAAPPEKVFEAFSTAELKQQWFHGPTEWEHLGYGLDFREGGHEFDEGGPSGEWSSRFDAIYHEIVPGQRIVYSYEMAINGKRISVSLATLQFLPDDAKSVGGCRLVLTEQGAYFDGGDNPSGRREGTEELLDQLVAAVDD